MRKVNFLAMFAAAALMIGVASCDKNDNNDQGTPEKTDLTVRISSPPTARAIDDPGKSDEGTIKVSNNRTIIYVFNSSDNLEYKEPLTDDAKTPTGQRLGQKVSSNARVYVVANIPTSEMTTFNGFSSLSEVQSATSEITTQVNYDEAALANSTGDATAIVPVSGSPGTATVTVTINPLISRMELFKLQGGSDERGTITAFKVTGVYVDNYHPQFTYSGGKSGIRYEQNQSTDFSPMLTFMRNESTIWPAAGVPPVATPGTGKVWAHNVASGDLPRFIIRLEDVKYMPSGEGATEVTETVTRYLTVTGYTDASGADLTEFVRGKIYRVGGDNGITFGPEDLGDTPNEKKNDLNVIVKVEEWKIETLTPKL